MGPLVGHVASGFAFLAIGLWHLFNNIKLFCLNPNTFASSIWFPTSKLRHLELYIIILVSAVGVIGVELFNISTERDQLFDSNDGTILPDLLHDVEHSFIAMSFLAYAVFALLIDRARSRAEGLTVLAYAAAFAQELFIFHFHSSDHMGIEGQYHLIFQLIIFISLLTTLMGIALPKSFLVSFVRSSSIAFQGVWLIVMGFMLYSPSLIPKDCLLHVNEIHTTVKCSTVEALDKAKSLANIEFNWLFVLTTTFTITLYLILERVYGGNTKYTSLDTINQQDDEEQQHIIKSSRYPSFVQMHKLVGHV
ncbi:unnamed protein product [Microthlaspi erraticum]|uniref:Uncharacterized protein n=1 Tax=Microthlaspi erraticum TaxID=1685480 RepID=A0A6D2HHF1_9BRAS|nr:unnamed protein product [Microthlaspi erraticum]